MKEITLKLTQEVLQFCNMLTLNQQTPFPVRLALPEAKKVQFWANALVGKEFFLPF